MYMWYVTPIDGQFTFIVICSWSVLRFAVLKWIGNTRFDSVVSFLDENFFCIRWKKFMAILTNPKNACKFYANTTWSKTRLFVFGCLFLLLILMLLLLLFYLFSWVKLITIEAEFGTFKSFMRCLCMRVFILLICHCHCDWRTISIIKWQTTIKIFEIHF